MLILLCPLRGYEHARSDAVIREGIEKIKAIGADAVLIDPQYAPKVIEHPQIEDMIGLISSAALDRIRDSLLERED